MEVHLSKRARRFTRPKREALLVSLQKKARENEKRLKTNPEHVTGHLKALRQRILDAQNFEAHFFRLTSIPGKWVNNLPVDDDVLDPQGDTIFGYPEHVACSQGSIDLRIPEDLP